MAYLLAGEMTEWTVSMMVEYLVALMVEKTGLLMVATKADE